MSNWLTRVSGCASFAFGIGLELADVTHEAIGHSLMLIGAVLWLVTAYPAYHWWRDKGKQTRPEQSSAVQPSSARELSDTEKLWLRSMWGEMLWNHGHVDRAGLLDDMLYDRPLNGSCWLCGKPRFREVEVREGYGEVHGE